MNKFWPGLFLTLIPGSAVSAYPEGSPVGYTGGFGRPTCYECHFDQPTRSGLEVIKIDGIGATYQPGVSYEIILTIDHPDQTRSGFQISFSDKDGVAAGALTILESGTEIIDGYLRSNEAVPGQVIWTFRWTAPDRNLGNILVHIAANASNNDDSPFGDTIYIREITLGTR